MAEKIASIPSKDLLGRTGSPYFPAPGLVEAANAARQLGLPLLLTGEPGSGKSDFAFAVARWLSGQREKWDKSHPEHGLLEAYIRSDSTSRSLLYEHDAVARFGDAQYGANPTRARDSRFYIRLQPLGVALASQRERVVLIDEIDKAPRDLPNDLLRELDQLEFEIPEIPRDIPSEWCQEVPTDGGLRLQRHMGRRPPGPDGDEDVKAWRARQPFVVLTSNEERQLPDAFLRRCVCFHIPPHDEKTLLEILRSRIVPPLRASEDVLRACVNVFFDLRSDHVPLSKEPSTGELIHFATAVAHPSLGGTAVEQAVLGYAKRPWHELPFIGCLIKLRGDLEALDGGY